jgi:outer membrane protein assembly factor BamB
MVATRPAGAQLLHDGKPLMRTVDGVQQPLVTPGLVLCQANQPVKLVAKLAGFEPREIVVNGKETAQVDAVLEVVPERVISFDAPGQTGVGVGDGWVAVGLRGGKLGIARSDGSERQVRELGGLKAVDSDPVIQSGRIFFVSNEMTVECVPLDPSVPVNGWPVQLTSQASTALALGDGRMILVDGSGVMHCWGQATGRRLWGVALNSAPSGTPTIEQRKAYVGTIDGRVMVFDIADGRSLGVLRSPAGLTTAIAVMGSSLFFGCSDGAVRAVDFDEGKVIWTESVGAATAPSKIALAKNSLLIAAEDRVLSLDLASGKRLGSMPTTGTVKGMQAQGNRAFVRVRMPSTRKLPVHDVLIACSSDTATVMWEFVLPSTGPGTLGVDRNVVTLPAESGQIVVFR